MSTGHNNKTIKRAAFFLKIHILLIYLEKYKMTHMPIQENALKHTKGHFNAQSYTHRHTNTHTQKDTVWLILSTKKTVFKLLVMLKHQKVRDGIFFEVFKRVYNILFNIIILPYSM